MTAQKGAAFLLKIGSGAAPVRYEAVAGLRTTQMSVNGDTVVVAGQQRLQRDGTAVRVIDMARGPAAPTTSAP